MTVHQHTREGNSSKPTKMCSLENGLWLLMYAGRPTTIVVADVCGETYSKNGKNGHVKN